MVRGGCCRAVREGSRERERTVASREKAGVAVEKFVRTTRDSYERILDHTVAMQERNVRFAQEMADGAIRELREQAESNRALAEEFVERAERQRDALQAVVQETLDAYVDLAFAPVSFYKGGLAVAGKAIR